MANTTVGLLSAKKGLIAGQAKVSSRDSTRYGEGCSADVQCQMARKLTGFDTRGCGVAISTGAQHGEPQ